MYVKINYDIYEYFERKINDEPLHCVNTLIYIYTSDWRAMLWKTMSFFKATLTPHGLWKKGCLGEEGEEVELEEKEKAFFHRVGNWQTEAAVFYMILRKLQHQ